MKKIDGMNDENGAKRHLRVFYIEEKQRKHKTCAVRRKDKYMGLFDSLKSAAERKIQQSVRETVTHGVKNAAQNMMSGAQTKTITFQDVPRNMEEFLALPESSMDSPFKTAALVVLATCVYKENRELCIQMLDHLNGPNDMSASGTQFLDERLKGKEYKPYSFFEGSSKENGYVPTKPLKISIFSNAYSKRDETHMSLWLTSSGSDAPRQIDLRLKPSTGEWFLNDPCNFLGDIKTPVSEDPWA